MTPSQAGALGYQKTKDQLKASAEKQHAEALARWEPTKCPNCNKQIPYKKRQNKFCNHSCAASFCNLGVQHNKPRNNHIYNENCPNCGNRLKGKQQYCDRKCQAEYNFKVRQLIVIETQDLSKAWRSEKAIKNYLLKVLPNQCSVCNATSWMGRGIPLIMDHIDGNSTNWKTENLRLICPNCDAQTDTYKGKNMGNGRYSRRLRYQNGGSY